MSHAAVDISSLLGDANRLFETLVVVRDAFPLIPEKEHTATFINYSDLLEMRDEFVEELVHTVVPFIYSADHQQKIIEQMGDDSPQAWSRLIRRARNKFRLSDVRGQFSELLLFNVLRKIFHAAPLIRKMSITTNPEMERHGADAIHIGHGKSGYVIYLGEAKTYKRPEYGLSRALKDAIDDVVATHYSGHRRELNLYTHEEFLPPELESIAQDYLDGRLTSASVEIVCLASYDHRQRIDGSSRDECVGQVLDVIRSDIKSINAERLVNGVPEALLPRFNYVCFGIAEIDQLIESFRRELGI